jgi:hypothetical protein
VSKPVACEADIQAKADTGMMEGDVSGTWSIVPPGLQVKTYSHLTVGGKPVAYEASCNFTYSGSTGSSATVATDSVTLSAGTTVLENGSSKVLLDGESAKGTTSSDNKIEVTSSQILKTD